MALKELSLATALASATLGGVLFGFSTFVVPGLRHIPPGSAAAAMQSINVQAPRSLLMLPLLGSGIGSVVLVVLVGWRHPDVPDRMLLLVGAGAGVLGAVITFAYHVPHNDAFGRLDPATAAQAWPSYVAGWVRWNHVRTAASLVSAGALVAGVMRR